LSSLRHEFRQFIQSDRRPCVMAKAAEKFDRITICDYGRMGSEHATRSLYRDLKKYVAGNENDPLQFESFVSAFTETSLGTEEEFEEALWEQLQALHDVDGCAWDPGVSNDPQCPKFSFSVAGAAFYIVGLHPQSGRVSRQFKYPAIAFNYHHQFEQLKNNGTFGDIKERIRQNDREKNGSINTMLEDFGESSEARQYSGRRVNGEWTCPLQIDQ